VAVIETMTFTLQAAADVEAFLSADRRLQVEFAYQQPGLVRRTTARDGDGGWIVIDLWESAADVDAMGPRWDADPVAAAFMAFVDAESVDVHRYETLD
jgi:hypothetical protein